MAAVNLTTLYLNGLKNGSLVPQIINGTRSAAAVYLGNSQDQGLSINILADNVASLVFNASGFLVPNDTGYSFEPLASTIFLASTLFDANLSRVPVACVFPISGQYDTLSRALFYCLMVFSLLFRRHIWLSVAALGTALVYAAVSAIHLLSIVSLFGFDAKNTYDISSSKAFADIDMIGILPILATSAIMVTPILLWSTTVRKNDVQSIIVWWGALILASLICLLAKVAGDGYSLNTIASFAICNKDCIPQKNLANFTLTTNTYQNCNCVDFCGTLGPAAPMRRGSNMVPFLDGASEKIVQRNGFLNLFLVNIVALVFIIIYGIMGLIVSRFSPDEVRNAIFRFCNADLRVWLKVFFEGEREDRILAHFNVTHKLKHRTFWTRCKYLFAKCMALSFTLVAGATAIICPAVFVSSVVANEILLQSYPLSEHSDAIGAWGTWVGALLVLVAAVINEYAGSWMTTLKSVFLRIWHRVQYSKKDRPKRKGLSTGARLKLFGRVITSPPVHAWCSFARSMWTLRTIFRFFMIWWRDTETVSQQRGKEIEADWRQAETAGGSRGKPECYCYPCRHHREKALQELEKRTKTTQTTDPTSNSLLPEVKSEHHFTDFGSSPLMKVISLDDQSNSVSTPSLQESPQIEHSPHFGNALPTLQPTVARQDSNQGVV